MKLRAYKTLQERRTALETECGITLSNIGVFSVDSAVAGAKNCENMIGVAQVPMGVAGPLLVSHLSGDHKEYYVPLATTEGALVASVSRGCRAITESGGATVYCTRVGTSRGPVFVVKNLSEQRELSAYIDTHVSEFKDIAEKTSHHLALTSVTSQMVGKYRYMRFVYDTQDAMGLNMVTIATEKVVAHIEEQTGAVCVALSGNFCVDKKPSWQNMLNNRGTAVWAEAVFPKDILSSVLKTDASHVYEAWLSKCMMGSVMSGSMGFNAQYANIIAALFIATGQDPAHVVEGSLGITTAEVVNHEDIYMSVYLPDVMVGTVGGGTGLSTQREALDLLGVSGSGKGEHSTRFAEVIGAAVLAGEISLLSSLAQGTLARAHQTLARGKTQ